MSALAVAPDGDVLYGTQTRTLFEGFFESAALLGRLAPDGTLRWERYDFPLALFTSFDELSVAPRGAIYAWGGRSLSGPSGPVAIRFDAEGLNSELVGGGFRGRAEIVGRACTASDTDYAGFVLHVPGR